MFVNTPGRVTHGVGSPEWSHRSYARRRRRRSARSLSLRRPRAGQVIDRYTALTGRAPDVPLWSLGLWISRAYYRTADEAIGVAEELRVAHAFPAMCSRSTAARRGTCRPASTFAGMRTRYPDPAATLARLKRHALKICVWEYPYVSVHSPLFRELAAQGFLLKTATGEPYVFDLGHFARDLAFRRRAHAAARIRHRRLHQPRRVRLVARCPRSAVQGRRRCDQERLRRARARRCGRVQRRSRRAPAQRLSAALQPLRLRGDREVRAAEPISRRSCGAAPAGRGSQRYPDPVGRRSAERLGRSRREHPRRAVVGHERRAVPCDRHRRLLRLGAALARNCICAGCR